MKTTFILLALSISMPNPALAWFGNKIGNAVAGGVRDAGKAVGEVARDAGKAAGEVARDAGKAVGDAGKTVGEVTREGGKIAVDVTKETGKVAANAVSAIGASAMAMAKNVKPSTTAPCNQEPGSPAVSQDFAGVADAVSRDPAGDSNIRLQFPEENDPIPGCESEHTLYQDAKKRCDTYEGVSKTGAAVGTVGGASGSAEVFIGGLAVGIGSGLIAKKQCTLRDERLFQLQRCKDDQIAARTIAAARTEARRQKLELEEANRKAALKDAERELAKKEIRARRDKRLADAKRNADRALDEFVTGLKTSGNNIEDSTVRTAIETKRDELEARLETEVDSILNDADKDFAGVS